MNDTLQPGRELDALVAEKVMGLKNIRRITDPMTQTAFGDMIYEAEKPDPYPENAGVWLGHCARVPHYSTDIAAAWEVVEKIGLLDSSCLRQCDGIWQIGSTDWDGGWYSETEADTAPLVICLNALKLAPTETSPGTRPTARTTPPRAPGRGTGL